ncbi:hypothetical protein [Acrocarpospora catenulata]|uniref:hypothetical protein n=1 Tax=Acrocarpospora catenulata TaxID=2836182 RepID=UPI001BDB4CF7|nr:hypothetical protein [Acrocarpospora catenulata]
MAFDWMDEKFLRINIVSWPSGEVLGVGRERARWEIKTLEEISTEELKRGLERLAVAPVGPILATRFEVTSPGNLTMVCEYDSSIPEPMRLGAASTIWRSLDESVARLWMIGSSLRAHYPYFGTQRRELLDLLPSARRLLWLAASLARAEPLMAIVAGRPSRFRRMVSGLEGGVFEEDVFRDISILSSGIADISKPWVKRRIAAPPIKSDLGLLVSSVGELLGRAIETQATDAIARCAEEILDVLYLCDTYYGLPEGSELAKQEDRAWWTDIGRLRDESPDMLVAMAQTAIECASAVHSACVKADVRRQFLDAAAPQRSP